MSLWTSYARLQTGIWSTSESFRRRLRELYNLDMERAFLYTIKARADKKEAKLDVQIFPTHFQ